jgi:hypothetical protein
MSTRLRKYKIAAYLVCLIAALVAPVLGAGRKVAGQVVLIGGDLQVSGYRASAGTTLFEGDSVVTGEAPAILALTDGTRVELAAHSEALILREGGRMSVQPRFGSVRRSTDLRKGDLTVKPLGLIMAVKPANGASAAPAGGISPNANITKLVLKAQSTVTSTSTSGPCPPNQPHCR